MRAVLLDTNALLWLMDERKHHNLGKRAQESIRSSVVYFSPISLTEISMKVMLKKLKPAPLTADVLVRHGLVELCYEAKHSEHLQGLQSLARHDPFDRMLLSQALSEGALFLTADSVLLDMDLDDVVDASL